MSSDKDDIRLYILMRNDMASLNAGKAVAQGAHAANQCVAELSSACGDMAEWMEDWQEQTEGSFGTTIVLAAPIDKIERAVDLATEYDLAAGMVFDPTYPLRDGEVTHLIPINTCGYIFGPAATCQRATNGLDLMP